MTNFAYNAVELKKVLTTELPIATLMKNNLLQFILVALTIIFAQSLWAGPRSLKQARAIAQRHARTVGMTLSPQDAPRKIKSCPNRASATAQSYFVFQNGTDKGFTIVSGDDRLPEIVGYSTHGTYNETFQSDGFRRYMKAFTQITERLEQGDSCAERQACMLKQRQEKEASANRVKVSPLLGDITWGQGTPFNGQCPLFDDKRAVTGCSSTAMAQILAYHHYPASMLKDTPAYVSSKIVDLKEYTIEVPSRSKGIAYDWEAILPSYRGDYSQRQADAVAQLLADCGAAMETNYSLTGSSASVMVDVLRDYFGYDADLLKRVVRSYYTQDEWERMIDQELLALRPVLYDGYDPQLEGHAFVCDGADGMGLYHINWGWNGWDNGYFDLAVLNWIYDGVVTPDVDDGYNMNMSMIVGIAPDNGKTDDLWNTGLDKVTLNNDYSNPVFAVQPRNDASEDFYISARLYFIVPPGKDVYLGIGRKEANGTLQLQSEAMHYDATQLTTYSNVKYFDLFSYACPVGETELFPMYSTDGENWIACESTSAHTRYRFNASVTDFTRIDPRLDINLEAEDVLYAKQDNVINLTFNNAEDQEIYASMSMSITYSQDQPTDYYRTLTVVVPAHSSVKRTLTINPDRAGDCYVWLRNGTGNNAECWLQSQPLHVVETEAPQFFLVDAGSNKVEGEMETSNAYYSDDQVEAPLTREETARFYFTLRNDGGDCNATICASVNMYNGKSSVDKHYVDKVYVKLPGNGAETKVYFEAIPNTENGRGHFVLCNLSYIDVGNQTYDIQNRSTLPHNYLMVLSSLRYYPFDISEQYVYVPGKADAINPVRVGAQCKVKTEKGAIVLEAGKAMTLHVYTLDGQCVRTLSLLPNVQQRIALSAGIYLVEEKMVVVP